MRASSEGSRQRSAAEPSGRRARELVPPPAGAPSEDPYGVAVCPHCWYVNPGAFRLCAGCHADMRTILQESGGLRQTAPVQSPMPVRARLTPLQRVLVLGFLVLLAVGNALAAFAPRTPRLAPPATAPR
jgi:hypothetical protein